MTSDSSLIALLLGRDAHVLSLEFGAGRLVHFLGIGLALAPGRVGALRFGCFLHDSSGTAAVAPRFRRSALRSAVAALRARLLLRLGRFLRGAAAGDQRR